MARGQKCRKVEACPKVEVYQNVVYFTLHILCILDRVYISRERVNSFLPARKNI